jgi:RNA polymerase sigma-70 factor (ECF subfamily)
MSDADPFEAFVRRYQDMVFATAVRLLGRPADAEDVAQTVFLRAFQRFDDIRDSPGVAGWLKTVTTNTALNHLTRYRSRWRLFSELEATGESTNHPPLRAYEDTLASSDISAAQVLEEADEQRRVERALYALPDHQRVPLVLFHFENLSYQQIAAMLGVSLGKVKTDIHRGRDALRQALSV